MTADAWATAADGLRPLLGDTPFELRFSATGAAAIRVRGDGVAADHAERPDPAAPWSASAHCGPAAGWLLAAAPPSDPEEAADLLARAVDRHAAAAAQALAAERARVAGELLDRLTHRLRTDVAALLSVAEGALRGLFAADETDAVLAELRSGGADAQDRMSDAREVMTVLHAVASDPEPVVALLERELEAAGADVAVSGPNERAMAVVPGHGWAICARLLATALARDDRLRGAALAVAPHPLGWVVTAGAPGAGEQAARWDEWTVGQLLHAGQIAAASGGAATARTSPDALEIKLILPGGASASG
jgi:hypothetical protein